MIGKYFKHWNEFQQCYHSYQVVETSWDGAYDYAIRWGDGQTEDCDKDEILADTLITEEEYKKISILSALKGEL